MKLILTFIALCIFVELVSLWTTASREARSAGAIRYKEDE